MSSGRSAPWYLVVVLGAVTFIMLHIHFVTAWEELYVVSPWPGLESAAREGLVEPWFGSTPRSLRVTQVVLFALAGVLGVMRSQEGMKTALALWLGVLLPLIPVLVGRAVTSDAGLVTISPMTNLPISWLALPLEALRTGVPVFVGVLAGLIVKGLAELFFG